MDFDILDDLDTFIDAADTGLEALLETPLPSDLFDFDLPDLSTLLLTTGLTTSLLADTSLVDSLLGATGSLFLDGSAISGKLTLDGVTTDIAVDLDTTLAELNTLLLDASGTLLLTDGQLAGDLTIDDSQYLVDIDVEGLVADSLTTLITSADFSAEFSNGVFTLDIPTGFDENIQGTLDFAGGDLDLNITDSPFGDFERSFAFPDDSQFVIPVNDMGISELELDLAAGLVRVPLGGTGSTPIDLPLTLFSGTLEVSNGEATLDISLGTLANVETTFDIGPLASQVASALVQDLSGEVTLGAGEIAGSFTSDILGTVEFASTVDDLIAQAGAFLDQTSGVLSLDGGTANLELDSPVGFFSEDFLLSSITDLLPDSSSLLTA